MGGLSPEEGEELESQSEKRSTHTPIPSPLPDSSPLEHTEELELAHDIPWRGGGVGGWQGEGH